MGRGERVEFSVSKKSGLKGVQGCLKGRWGTGVELGGSVDVVFGCGGGKWRWGRG